MSQESAVQTTAPKTLTKTQIVRFAVAFFAFNLLWAAGLQIVAAVLLPQRLMEIAPDSYNAVNGVLSSVTALGQMVGPMITSAIVVATGGYGVVFPVAIVAVLVACVFIMLIRKVK